MVGGASDCVLGYRSRIHNHGQELRNITIWGPAPRASPDRGTYLRWRFSAKGAGERARAQGPRMRDPGSLRERVEVTWPTFAELAASPPRRRQRGGEGERAARRSARADHQTPQPNKRKNRERNSTNKHDTHSGEPINIAEVSLTQSKNR